MNIHPLIAAVENLDTAFIATINPQHRQEIHNCTDRLRAILREHGVFIGQHDEPEKPAKPCIRLTADGQRLTPAKIKGFQQSYRLWPSAGIRAIDDAGNAFIETVTHQPRPCGCGVTGNGTIQFPLTVAPCEKHQDRDLKSNKKFKFKPYKSIDGPDTRNNGNRAEWAEAAFEEFKDATHTHDEQADAIIQDLICDLGHLADREGLNFDEIVRRGLATWQDER